MHKINNINLLLSVLIALISLPVMAASEDVPAPSAVVAVRETSAGLVNLYDPQGFVPMFGGGLGYLGSSDVSGLPAGGNFTAKILGSYYLANRQWVGDVGFGLQQQFNNRGSNIFAGLIELNGRYRLPEGWQIGPVWQSVTGSSSTYGSSSSSFTSFFGIGGAKEFVLNDSYLARVGARMMTGVGIVSDSLNVVMVDFAISWPSGESTSVVEDAPLASPPRRVVIEEEAIELQPPMATVSTTDNNTAPIARESAAVPSAPAQHLIQQSRSAVVPEPALGAASLTLAKKDLASVRRVSSTVAQNSRLFQTVEVIGRADKAGPAGRTLRVARDNARDIASRLEEAGVPAEKIRVTWEGNDNVKSGSELKFYGVTNEDELKRALRASR